MNGGVGTWCSPLPFLGQATGPEERLGPLISSGSRGKMGRAPKQVVWLGELEFLEATGLRWVLLERFASRALFWAPQGLSPALGPAGQGRGVGRPGGALWTCGVRASLLRGPVRLRAG